MWEKLVDAIEHKNVEVFRQILRQSPELVVAKSYQDETPLHFAAKSGSLEIVAELLVKGAKPDLPDEFGWTPLHEACSHGHEDVVALFGKLVFNVDGISKQHETALHISTRHGNAKIVARLLKAGANVEIRNLAGNTPLQVAALAGRIDIMQMLLDGGADITARNLAGETMLHCAAREGRIEATEWCLAHGADPTDLDKGVRTFIDCAMRDGRMSFIEHFANLEEPIATPDQPDPMTITGIRKLVATEARDQATQALTMKGKMIHAFLFGSFKRVGKRRLSSYLEMGLWFFGFPFLVFVVWSGFYQGAVPHILNIPGMYGPWVHGVETLINTFLIFLGSHLLISTAKNQMNNDQIFLDLRPTLYMRVLHFALLDALIFRLLSFDPRFWLQFAEFWLLFLFLYCLDFMVWWRNWTPCPTKAPPPELPKAPPSGT